MSIKLFLAGIYIPVYFRKAKLIELFKITSEVFGNNEVQFSISESLDDLLLKYAIFTKHESEKALDGNYPLKRIQDELYNKAFSLGAQFRKDLNIKSTGDSRLASGLIYKALKIDFKWREDGTVCINRCFFSKYYSSRVCSLISSLDSGLIAGLSGGYILTFTERITENSPCCKAIVTV